MGLFAHEVSQVLHSMGSLEEFAVKTADEKDTALIGAHNAGAAIALYGVMAKDAGFAPDGSNPYRMCKMVTKFAQELGKPSPDSITQLKIAAAVAVDDTFSDVLAMDIRDSEKAKIAELRAYGREYLAELLRGVI